MLPKFDLSTVEMIQSELQSEQKVHFSTAVSTLTYSALATYLFS